MSSPSGTRSIADLAIAIGWRIGTIALVDGHHWLQRSLLGVTTGLGRWGQMRGRFGAEVSVLWVKHGGDLPTRWIGLDRSLIDHVRLGMFVRLEYETTL